MFDGVPTHVNAAMDPNPMVRRWQSISYISDDLLNRRVTLLAEMMAFICITKWLLVTLLVLFYPIDVSDQNAPIEFIYLIFLHFLLCCSFAGDASSSSC